MLMQLQVNDLADEAHYAARDWLDPRDCHAAERICSPTPPATALVSA